MFDCFLFDQFYFYLQTDHVTITWYYLRLYTHGCICVLTMKNGNVVINAGVTENLEHTLLKDHLLMTALHVEA